MTKSEEWEQFSAYRPMIEDAVQRGREQREQEIIALLEDPANHRNDVEPDWYAGVADAIELIKGKNNEES